MFQKLVNHNEDIRRLVDKGYAVAFDSNYLVVRDIPYLDDKRNLQIGAFVTKLEFVDQNRVVQQDHQVFFAGGVPHQLDGRPIVNLGGGSATLSLSNRCTDVVVERSFSNKPREGGRFADFFAKIESYVNIISGPAIEHYGVTPYTYRVDTSDTTNGIFKFHDTLTSRAEITELSQKFENDVVAVIGLGGTGGYVLDFLVKTPVKEIRSFDLDPFHVHNAFRSPGKLDPQELGKSKAEVYRARYDNFRHGLKLETKLISADSTEDLDGVTFAFVCVDKGASRAGIFDLLIAKGIPFIDVGMGLHRKTDGLSGMIRVTYYPPEQAAQMKERNLAELQDGPDNLYRTNIQISELNALNASLAIIRFKQLRGFYITDDSVLHLLFNVADLKIIGECRFDEI